eukprot:CAMPEP_0174848918 /NCGR_PEP_ID=MMETSP1114-20130205/13804_1 /TAXON_ID=312471 /ORGANISM="Neobodo designis, Strain CCAP 1951/1" /LENGTH=347 /DNA_ID=CAMNT_0016083223 /DNA_START=32 /DNA_END=1075 /DNA_ORIENTATION=+
MADVNIHAKAKSGAATEASLERPLVADSITELIGKTPMLRLPAKINDTHASILLKMESENPMASVKDRLAISIIQNAEKDGLIRPGDTLIEATSGNTGVALAQVGAALGYKVVICMPETMSLERRALIRIFGARLVLTPAKLGVKGSIAAGNRIHEQTERSYLTRQFETEYNAKVHRETTGPEVWAQTQGKVDVFLAGAGTGGTITGVTQYLKAQNPAIRSVVVEPKESQVLKGEAHSPHKIQGIGPGFKPDVIDLSIIDEILPVSSDDAIDMSRRLAAEAGIFGGFSAGAAVAAALAVAKREESAGKTIVAVLPSFGERYLSTALYASITEEVKNQAVEEPDQVNA